jgi:hypothetical protein
MVDRVKAKRIPKLENLGGPMPQVSCGATSPRSRKMLDHSAASLKKDLASAPILKRKKIRLGALKGRMKIKDDIIHSDLEDDWEV